MKKLDWYRWSGHAFVVGRRQNQWQAVDYVLGWFGDSPTLAKKNYRQFVQSGIDQGSP
jgi:hypothetical protein